MNLGYWPKSLGMRSESLGIWSERRQENQDTATSVEYRKQKMHLLFEKVDHLKANQ